MKVLLVQKMVGVSGSEKYIQNVLTLLRQAGVDAQFCCVQNIREAHKNEQYLKELKRQSIPVALINYTNSASPGIVYRLYKVIKKGDFDIVQTNLIHADFWGALIKKFTGTRSKFIGYYHGYDEYIQSQGGFDPAKNKRNLYYRLAKFSSANHDFSVAISEGLGNFLVKTGIVQAGKLKVIHYGFDFAGVGSNHVGSEFRYSHNQLVIVGRLIPYKQQDLIIKILPSLKQSFPDLKLVLVGNGSSKGDLESLANTLGVTENVYFTGFVHNTHDYIAASDIMLVPSKSEGFGVVILEGFYNKKPVLAFDVPAPNEIVIDGYNGFLVAPYDADALKERIAFLLTNKDKLRAMGENAYQTLNTEFTNEKMLEKTIALYNDVLNEGK